MNYNRIHKLKSILLRELSEIIRTDCKDPRLDFSIVSLMDLILPNDLSFARAYISTLDDKKSDLAVSILEKKRGFIRKLLGQRLHLKKIPQLHFFKDSLPQEARHINMLLNSLNDNLDKDA